MWNLPPHGSDCLFLLHPLEIGFPKSRPTQTFRQAVPFGIAVERAVVSVAENVARKAVPKDAANVAVTATAATVTAADFENDLTER